MNTALRQLERLASSYDLLTEIVNGLALSREESWEPRKKIEAVIERLALQGIWQFYQGGRTPLIRSQPNTPSEHENLMVAEVEKTFMIATKGIVQKVVRQALSPNRLLIDRIEGMDRSDPARWERIRSAVGRWVEGLLWGHWKEDRDFISWGEVLDLPEFQNLPQRRIYGVPTFKVRVEPSGKGRIWAQVLILHNPPRTKPYGR